MIELPPFHPACEIFPLMEGADIPNVTAVYLHRSWHPPVRNELVKLACRDANIHCGLVTRETSARNRSDIGESASTHASLSQPHTQYTRVGSFAAPGLR
jgi:hypothetical protein